MHERHHISVLTENKPGALYAIAHVFLRRRINVAMLHVEEIDPIKKISRFDIEIETTPETLTKVVAQINKIVEVLEIEAGIKVKDKTPAKV